MNWLSCEVPKNSRMLATTGRMLISVWGVIASTSCVVRLADDALHPGQAGTHLVLDELADAAKATVAEVVDVVDLDSQVDVVRPSRRPFIVGSPACRTTRSLIVATMSSMDSVEAASGSSSPSFLFSL